MAPLYGLDIETDTRHDGLDPTRSAVVAAAVCGDDGCDDVVLAGDERSILSGLDELFDSIEPGVIVTWNGGGFDLPFLAHRAVVHGVALGLQIWGDSPERPWPPPPRGCSARWSRHAHLDGYRLFRGDVRRVLGVSCGLKAMARLVGIDAAEVDRARIHELGDDVLREYVASDARIARELVLRRGPAALAWVDRPPRGGEHTPAAALDPAGPGWDTAPIGPVDGSPARSSGGPRGTPVRHR